MLKKIVLAVVLLFGLGSLAIFFWARSVFSNDNMRATLAARLSQALGQPVTIGTSSATIYPRITITLGDVAIGQPAGVQIAKLHVATDLRALLSRRIEHATARLEGAKIQLPLLPLGGGAGPLDVGGGSLIELVSIDEVVVSGAEVISRGRTLRGDIEAVPEPGGAVSLRRVSLRTEDASIEATGRLTDLNGPRGELTLKASELNLDRLLGFFLDFSATPISSTGTAGGPATRTSKADITASITANRAHFVGVTLEAVAAKAHVTDAATALKPITFGMFGGQYDGSLTIGVAGASAPEFGFTAKVTNIDVPAVLRFFGAQDSITGRLSGQLQLTGIGPDAAAAMQRMRGTSHVSVSEGVVRNLGLVRAIIVSTSMRGGTATLPGASAALAAEGATSRDEPFKSLSATLTIAGFNASTNDLRLEGNNVSLAAHGSLALNGNAVHLAGLARLSQALTNQAGRDLIRYTRDDSGRVTLPVEISGPVSALTVQIDVADALNRAIKNRIEDEAQKAILKGLGGLLKKPK